jgi:NADPH:quinone reductase-like Zn-dependent oxidoreductase
MKAVLLLGHGGLDRLVYREDVAVPVPAAGEVLVRVAAAAVNNTDINLRTGWYSRAYSGTSAASDHPGVLREDGGWAGDAVSFPRIQGADACGHIVEVGAAVDAKRVNERVLIDPIIRTSDGSVRYFGSDTPGAFAEFVAVPAANAIAIRSDLRDEDLASFPCSYLAAENLLERAGVSPGQAILVTGASGGVGSAAVQLAQRREALVHAVADSAKAEAILSLGATRVVPRDADLIAEFGHESIDVVIDVVGGVHFAQLLGVLRRNGRYACAGAIGGPLVELDLRTLYLKDLSLVGCTIPAPEVFRSLIGYIERREIRPLVSAIYPLRDIAAAQTAFLSKQHVGKIVLIP